MAFDALFVAVLEVFQIFHLGLLSEGSQLLEGVSFWFFLHPITTSIDIITLQ